MMKPMVAEVATDFDRATAAAPVEGQPGEFTVDLDPGWSSLVGVHGGYLCAVVVRGAESLAEGRAVRTVSTSFLRTGQVGPATLSIRELRSGRTITTMTADLVQDGRLVTASRLTLLSAQVGVEWSEPSPLELPPPSECVRFEPPGHVVHFARVDSAFDPTLMPFSGDRARVSGTCARSRPVRSMPHGWRWPRTGSPRRRSRAWILQRVG